MRSLLFFSLFFTFNIFGQGLDPYKIDYSNSEPLEYDDSSNSDNFDNSNNSDNSKELFVAEQETPLYGSKFLSSGYSFFPIYERIDQTTTAAGIDFSYYFRRAGESLKSNPNYLRTTFTAGQNQYVKMGIGFNNYWKNDLNNLYASFNYNRRWASFYQISQKTPFLLGEYRASDFDFILNYRQRVFADSYIGIRYNYQYNDMSSRTPASVFSESTFMGLTGSVASGLGVILGNLPNEDIYTPRTSFAYEIANMFYLSAFGSKSDFGKHTFDFREYLGLLKNHMIALQLYMNFLSGTPTYKQLSSIGDLLRAYDHDRYLDYHMIIFRGEYRWMMFDRFMLTAFLGAGYHSNSIKKFRLNDYLPSYGAGFRYFLNSELNSFARLEYFEGRGSRGFMFGIGDSF